MGVGISRSSLAGSVAKLGGVGVLSGVQIGYDEEDFETNTINANLRALKKHIKKAKEISSENGIIGINFMVAMKEYETYVKEAIKSGIDLIISGAGLPAKLPSLTKGTNTKIAPIVSSAKAAKVILKMWERKDKTTADILIVEGPNAGGHLGFNGDEIENLTTDDYDNEFKKILEIAKDYGSKFNKEIPVIAAGGIYSSDDVKKYIDLGASGVQVGTRFIATEECDADEKFKLEIVNAQKEDIQIVKSPVGLPGRAIKNSFIDKVKLEKEKITKCYNCLIPCDPKETPYCISKALINAVKGDTDNALLFCGSEGYKIDSISTVEEVISDLTAKL